MSDPHPIIEEELSTTVIKCCLKAALLPSYAPRAGSRVLSSEQATAFIDQVVLWSATASRMVRRASLLLNYHVAKEHDPRRVGDLRSEGSAYWRDLLRAGETVCGRVVFPNDHVKEAFADIQPYLDKISPGNLKDQILTYTSDAYGTVVSNNFWVPLIPRVERLTRLLIREKNEEFSWYEAMAAVRKGNIPDKWPQEIQDVVLEVRRRLGLSGTAVLYDKYGKECEFATLFSFYKWAQGEFKRLNSRQMVLIPTASVKRHHIRIDRKILLSMLLPLVPKDDPVLEEFLSLRDCCNALPETSESGKKSGKIHDPSRDLPKLHKLKKRSEFETDEEYTLEKEKVVKAKAAREAAESSDDHKGTVARYQRYEKLGDMLLTSFFHLPERVLRGRGDWKPSFSTDGISVSFQFEKLVPKTALNPEKFLPSLPGKMKKESCSSEQWESYQLRVKEIQKKRSEARKDSEFQRQLRAYESAKKSGDKAESTEDYDRSLATTVCIERKLAILGIDPGRTNIATVVMMYFDGRKLRKFTRSLSRKQYYSASGITDAQRRRQKWHSGLQEAWKDINSKGALRTNDHLEIREYIKAVAPHSEEWWATVMKPREARASFSAYIGKRRVLDGFFSEAKRTAALIAKKHYGEGFSVEAAYGSAGPTMKSTGRSEMAVPTTGAYKACVRAMPTSLTWEYNTTAKSWGGESKELVYQVPYIVEGKLRFKLRHTSAICAPAVKAEHMEAYEAYVEQLPEKFREKIREANKQRKPRYTDIRGLKFCPETLNYLDRDVDAACTIGRLRLLEVLGKGRPAPFCPKKNETESATD